MKVFIMIVFCNIADKNLGKINFSSEASGFVCHPRPYAVFK